MRSKKNMTVAGEEYGVKEGYFHNRRYSITFDYSLELLNREENY